MKESEAEARIAARTFPELISRDRAVHCEDCGATFAGEVRRPEDAPDEHTSRMPAACPGCGSSSTIPLSLILDHGERLSASYIAQEALLEVLAELRQEAAA